MFMYVFVTFMLMLERLASTITFGKFGENFGDLTSTRN